MKSIYLSMLFFALGISNAYSGQANISCNFEKYTATLAIRDGIPNTSCQPKMKVNADNTTVYEGAFLFETDFNSIKIVGTGNLEAPSILISGRLPRPHEKVSAQLTFKGSTYSGACDYSLNRNL